MAAQGRIYHSSSLSSGISGGWSSLGENVGMGGSVSHIESMFEASSAHRDNLLNPSFTQIGVGVASGSDGTLYVTEVFVGRADYAGILRRFVSTRSMMPYSIA